MCATKKSLGIYGLHSHINLLKLLIIKLYFSCKHVIIFREYVSAVYVTVHAKSLLCHSFSWHRAGGRLCRPLQDGLTPQVVGQRAIGPPECKLPVNAHFDHLFLPRDGDVPWGKFIEKSPVGIHQLHAFNGGEGPHVINVLCVNCLGVWQKRGCKDPCRDASRGGDSWVFTNSNLPLQSSGMCETDLRSVSSSWCHWRKHEPWARHMSRSWSRAACRPLWPAGPRRTSGPSH